VGKKTLFYTLTPTSTLFQLTVAIILRLALTGVPAKTTDLPHIKDTFFQNIYMYMIKSLVEFYNKKIFRNE